MFKNCFQKINWTEKDIKVIKAFQSFVLNLVSAHMPYLGAVLELIVKKFMPGKTDIVRQGLDRVSQTGLEGLDRQGYTGIDRQGYIQG